MRVAQIDYRPRICLKTRNWPVPVARHVNTSRGNLLTARPASCWALPVQPLELAPGAEVKYVHEEPVFLPANFQMVKAAWLQCHQNEMWKFFTCHKLDRAFQTQNVYMLRGEDGNQREKSLSRQPPPPCTLIPLLLLYTHTKHTLLFNLLRKQNFKINPRLLSQVRI